MLTAVGESVIDGTIPFSILPRVAGGRYGLASKEFTPAMVKAVFDELKKATPKNHFCVGIEDDVTFTSLPFDPEFSTESGEGVRALFWGLGADGTVGANKNTIKIIGEQTPNYAQGYFVYDSKKSGAMTVSHLRFGPRPIKSTYLVRRADFVAVHQFNFVEKYDVLASAGEGATVLLNSPYGPEEVWEHLPLSVQQQIIERRLTLQPGARRRGQEPVPVGFGRPEDSLAGLHLHRGPLPDAPAERPGGGRVPARPRAGGRQRTLAAVQATRASRWLGDGG